MPLAVSCFLEETLRERRERYRAAIKREIAEFLWNN